MDDILSRLKLNDGRKATIALANLSRSLHDENRNAEALITAHEALLSLQSSDPLAIELRSCIEEWRLSENLERH